MPVGWEELPHIAGSAHWTVADAVQHLRRRRSDPWAGYWRADQRLGPALKKLDLR